MLLCFRALKEDPQIRALSLSHSVPASGTMEKTMRAAGEGEIHGNLLIGKLPQSLLLEILSRLDLESLCSAAPVCRYLCSSVSQTLFYLSSLDLSGFSPRAEILSRVVRESGVLRTLTLDCSRLDDSSFQLLTNEHLEELVLLKCFNFSSYIFTAIGEKCSKLRLLTVEVIYQFEREGLSTWKKAIAQMLKGCSHLESLRIKFMNEYFVDGDYEQFNFVLPSTLKFLLLQPVSSQQAQIFTSMASHLQSLSLVLDIITDELLISIAGLHLLIDLCLEDKPSEEPSPHNDLTNAGLMSLGLCRNLKCLSLTRSREYYPSTFRRVNDFGILLLAEKCNGLELIRLAGFSKVTDAGYGSILHSCKSLKKFEIANPSFLSDLAFHNLGDASTSLVNVRLISCNLLTSDTASSLSFCQNMESLDLSGCMSIADPGLKSISELCKLTTLDLSGTDITDSGLSSLGMGSSPIASLCLRGCRRVSDRGLRLLLQAENSITRNLGTLDLGYMPRISDRGVILVAEVCRELTSLCIRNCFFVTDASIRVLGSIKGFSGERRPIKRLDLYNCCGLSMNSFEHLAAPSFLGLRWLGVGHTRLSSKGKEKLVELSRSRAGLSICMSGCEIGCRVGWPFHEGI